MKESSQDRPKISIVIPCRNERNYIAPCLDSILANAYPQDRLEILIADGGSMDGTREIISGYMSEHSGIRLLDNPGKTTPRAFNLGIKNATGELIMIMNAHSTYPRTYIADTLNLLLSTDAENAGGRVVNVANGSGQWSLPVATVTAHRFGVGNSAFRTSEGKPCYADTVAYGLYRKKIFNEIGLFDERLTRNQDNELNARLRRHGYKIIFNPAIEIYYKNQPTLLGLIRQGFFTGMWNIYTLTLHPYTFKWRRFIPSLFVSYLLSLPIVFLLTKLGHLYLLPAAAYTLINLAISLTRRHRLAVKARISLTFLGYHAAYGSGTLFGLMNILTGRWKNYLGMPLKK